MYWRVISLLLIGSVLFVVHATSYVAGQKNVRLEYAIKANKQEETFRAIERKLVVAKNKAEEDYEALKRTNARSFAAARTELAGLRNALTDRERHVSTDPTTCTGVDAGSTERQLLSESAEALVNLAAEADRLSNQVTGLQSYVNNVCLAQ